jgi:GNAT superfamily N-acetyltransferase
MRIRPRDPRDLPALTAALAEVHRADGYPSRWPDDAAGWLTPRAMIVAWVAEDGGQLAGHVALGQEPFPGQPRPGQPAPDQPAPSVAVHRLFVTPGARGRGAASLLLAAAMDQAARTGTGLWLEVTEGSDAAIALYLRHGWRYAGRDLASWTTAGGEHPVIRRYLAPDLPQA